MKEWQTPIADVPFEIHRAFHMVHLTDIGNDIVVGNQNALWESAGAR